jgi:sugar transferase (PEP-CTERM system associated)
MRRMKFLLILGDIFLIIIALYTSDIFMSYSHTFIYRGIWEIFSLALFVLTVIFSSFLCDLYNHRKAFTYTKTDLSMMIPLAIMFSTIILSIMNLLLPNITFGWRFAFFTLSIFGVYQFVWRIVYKSLICSSALIQRILVLGSGERTMKLASVIASSKRNYIMVGCYDPSVSSVNTSPEPLKDMVKKELVDIVIVALRQRRGSLPLQELLDCKLAGIEVVDSPTFYEELQGKLLLEEITPSWFIFSDGFKLNSGRKRFKRIIDIFLALIGVICSLPFVPILAIMIKLESKGPVFFSQIRMGEREKHYHMYKLRTMEMNAESQTGAVWAQKNDSRITRVGRIFRKLRIDELPQFYNVLKGDMSFIGPRPERPEFAERLKTISPYYSERHCVKPGITGLAQVMYSYGASEEDALEKLRYDLYYVKNLSFQLECTVILETIKVILFGRGSR